MENLNKHGSKSDAGPITPDSEIWWLERLLPLVKANGKPGSRIQQAFAILEEQFGREGGPNWGAKHMAAEAWGELPDDEKRRILNGWEPRKAVPTAREAFTWIGHASAEPVLHVSCNEGAVCFMPDVAPDAGGLGPVGVNIRQGTDLATAVASVRLILAAMEKHYAAAIRLAPDEDMEVRPETGATAEPVGEALAAVAAALEGVRAALQLPVAPAAPAAGDVLPVGTLVRDAWQDDAGIIVGSFKGENGTLYVYRNAMGELDSQFEAGLKTADRPAAKEARPAGGASLVVGLGGKPVTGKKLLRRVRKARRGVAAAA